MNSILAWLHCATYKCICPPWMPCFLWKNNDKWVNNFKLWDATFRLSPLKLQHHVIMLNFEFPNREIHCSSFPPPCPTCSHPPSSTYSILPPSLTNCVPTLTNGVLPPSTNGSLCWRTTSPLENDTLLLPPSMNGVPPLVNGVLPLLLMNSVCRMVCLPQ